jgi:hypothetical protein
LIGALDLGREPPLPAVFDGNADGNAAELQRTRMNSDEGSTPTSNTQ